MTASSMGCTPLFLNARSAQHRVSLGVDGQLADGALDLVDRELFATEVLLQQRLVGLGDRFEQLGAVLVGLLLKVLGDLDGLVGLAELGLAAPDLGVHLDQVDDALEVTLGADGQLDRQRTWRRGAPRWSAP